MFSKKKFNVKSVTLAILCLALMTAVFWSRENQVMAVNGDDSISRIYGADRFETSSLISQEGFETADKVFITNAREFADALAGVPLAYQHDAPILLAQGNKLKPTTVKEIKRLNAKEAIILGGENAVSPAIEQELKNMGLSTRRIAGDTRFKTAEFIAKELQELTQSDYAAVVDGFEYADAMSIAPIAAQEGFPIFLSHSHKLTSKEALTNYDETVIIGGETAISKDVEKLLNNPSRIEGSDRYETNVNVLNYYGVNTQKLYIATGLDFPDALTGSLLAAKNDSAVALVRRGITEQLDDFMHNRHMNQFVLFGGEHVLGQSVEKELSLFLTQNIRHSGSLRFDNELNSVIIYAEGVGAELIEIDNMLYTHTAPELNTLGAFKVRHPISQPGTYAVTILGKNGDVLTVLHQITEEEFEDMGRFDPTYSIEYDEESSFYVLNVSSPNVAQVTDPLGNVYDKNSPEINLHHTFELDYRTLSPGTHDFIFESVWGEKEVLSVELTEEYYYEPSIGTSTYLDKERRSIVIELGISPAYELMDPDGVVHQLTPDEDGNATFTYEVAEPGDYIFTARNKSGREKEITIEVKEEFFDQFSGKPIAINKSYDEFQDEVALSLVATDVFSITDPDGTVHKMDESNTLMHSYRVSEPGKYVFIIENILGHKHEIPVTVTAEDFKNE